LNFRIFFKEAFAGRPSLGDIRWATFAGQHSLDDIRWAKSINTFIERNSLGEGLLFLNDKNKFFIFY
jgi:hypothetical protein